VAGTLKPRERSGHDAVSGFELFRAGTGHVAGPEGAIRVHQAGDAIAAETPVGLGMAIGNGHGCSVDSPIP
jgi:hypothetical protein